MRLLLMMDDGTSRLGAPLGIDSWHQKLGIPLLRSERESQARSSGPDAQRMKRRQRRAARGRPASAGPPRWSSTCMRGGWGAGAVLGTQLVGDPKVLAAELG